MSRPRKGGTSYGSYPSYLFRSHDPILDAVDTVFELARLDGYDVRFSEVAAETRLSVSTLSNWRKRKTKKPQVATVAAVVNFLGGEMTVTYGGKTLFLSQKRNG